MGRIKTQLVKRTTMKLYAEHKDSFKKNFEENKKVVGQYAEFKTKKLRNLVAGYVTRLVKINKEL